MAVQPKVLRYFNVDQGDGPTDQLTLQSLVLPLSLPSFRHLQHLKGLTCDIQGDWGASCVVFAQVAGESGTVVFIDDGCNTHAAATVLISLLQTDDGTIPQPDQLIISLRVVAAVMLTNQRHSLFQLCLYNTIGAGQDLDSLGKERGAESWNWKGWLSEAVRA